MKILVTIKQVTSLDEDFELRDDGRDVEADFHVFDLNEWDHYALEEAMRLKEAAVGDIEVVVATIGPNSADDELRKCLAKGADRAIRVWSDELAEADPIGIARVLAALARKEAPDMIFAGVQASDHAYGATGMALAGLSIGSGREAYQTATVQVGVAIGLGMIVVCWVWAGRLLRLPEEERVFHD